MFTIGGILVSIFTSLFDFGKSAIESTTIKTVAGMKYSASVITSAMSHKMYWWAWGIAVVPMSIWFGWGMLDTTLDGALPDVAAIPPGLQPYADAVWSNLFWTGGGLAAVETGFTILGNIFGRR